jgi:hypothetical protein
MTTRRLAAILAADMVGYSHLMGAVGQPAARSGIGTTSAGGFIR